MQVLAGRNATDQTQEETQDLMYLSIYKHKINKSDVKY